MVSFGERFQIELDRHRMTQAESCKRSGLKSGRISPYLNDKKDCDPRLSAVVKIAEALDVSPDYSAGRTDNPARISDEELEGIRIDSQMHELLRGFDRLPPEGKASVAEQVDFQLSKSRDKENRSRPAPAPMERIA